MKFATSLDQFLQNIKVRLLLWLGPTSSIFALGNIPFEDVSLVSPGRLSRIHTVYGCRQFLPKNDGKLLQYFGKRRFDDHRSCENHFDSHQNPARSSYCFAGAAVVPAAVIGNVLGGSVIRWLRLHCSGMLLMALVADGCCLFFGLGFLLYCPVRKTAGITTHYR